MLKEQDSDLTLSEPIDVGSIYDLIKTLVSPYDSLDHVTMVGNLTQTEVCCLLNLRTE